MKKAIGMTMGVIMAAAMFGSVMSVSAAEPAADAAPADAVSIIAENEIGMDQAVQTALEDAGLTEDKVQFSKKINEFSDGKCKYDIHFIIPGETKFEYELDAMTGDILERDQELWEADDDLEYQGLLAAGQGFFDIGSADVQKALEEAFQAAIKDAGLSEDQVTIYQYGVGYDEGNVILEANFFIPGETKFDYDVVLETKAIDDRDQEVWEADDDAEYGALLAALAGAGAAPEVAAPAAADPATADGLDYVAIALKDAGFSEADIQMIKAEKDLDDGVEIFEVDFFGPDGMKYEYDLSFLDGTIMDKDVDFDD